MIHDQEKHAAEQEMLQVKVPSSSAAMDLPSPVSAQTPKTTPTAAKYKLSAATIIPIWIVLSSSVIIYNNYLYNSLSFKYPVFLVTWHLGFAAIGTRILQRTTHLLDGVKDVHMTKEILILSNTAYLYLSVSYIQMLKAFTPVAILLISWVSRLQDPNRKLAVIVLMISTGVALASHGSFGSTSWLPHTICRRCSSRLVMIQILLHNLKMDPLVSLHYYAPVCAIINLFFLPFTEGLAPFYELQRLGVGVLVTNASVAFLLNVAAVFLVGVGSGLVLTLAGVFKLEKAIYAFDWLELARLSQVTRYMFLPFEISSQVRTPDGCCTVSPFLLSTF
ncbi:hypothetical protein BDZ97DRAFT_1756443 [Flammula alnicola]|nr:hypothetical protein BDZ97DRAFT_1756443 [Flammula alnicola]